MSEIKRFFDMAVLVANQSLDPNRKVGAVLVMRDDQFIVAHNTPAWPNEETFDFYRSNKNDFMVHAEMGVLLYAGMHRARGATMYVTDQPCIDCAKHIVSCGVSRVLWLERPDRNSSKWIESWTKAEWLLSANGVLWAGFERTKNDYVLRRGRTKND